MEFESGGVRLHFEEHGSPEGRPVVLVHGFASHYRLNWVGTRWQETLTNAGFRVIGLDCRGHGDSEKPHDRAAYAPEAMAADLSNLLDHLGLKSADCLGFSMGARIGLQSVLDFPDRWKKAVLAGIGRRSAVDHAAAIAKALRGGPAEDPIAKMFYDFAAARPHNDLEALAACIEAQQAPVVEARLAAIKTPILIVVGDKDELVSGAEELVEAIPTAKLVTVPGRDHLGTVPAQEFKDAALAFLEQT